MKVLCIRGVCTGDVAKNGRIARKEHVIREGKQYHVKEVVQRSYGEAYILRGKPPLASYNVNRFIPLSDIDETQMERDNLKEEITCTQ